MSIFAEEVRRGGEGIRVAIKDSIDMEGIPTRFGSRAFAGAAPADRSAEIVDRILAAGCRIVGKTNLHEFAFGVTGINDWTGTPVNPRFPDLIPGGSSSGSAVAVAAGLADFAVGTDTGGSIRIPAACCGIFGLKPSFGRVSRAGVHPSYTTLDCVGGLAASLPLLVAGMRIIDPSFLPVATTRPRIGMVATDCAPEIGRAIRVMIDRAGLACAPVELHGMQDAYLAGMTVINAETWKAYAAYADSPSVGADVAKRLKAASATTAEDLKRAEAVRRSFRAEVDRALDDVEVLVLPSLPTLPPSLSVARANRTGAQLTAFVRPFNLSGHPALSVPVPATAMGPIALQVVGRHGSDELVCAVAELITRG